MLLQESIEISAYWKTDMVNNYVSDVEFRDSSLVVSVCTFILFYLIFKIQRSDDDDDS